MIAWAVPCRRSRCAITGRSAAAPSVGGVRVARRAKNPAIDHELVDVSAATIARADRYRRQIESFFRWLSVMATSAINQSHAGRRHHAFHVTAIGVLPMYLHLGHRPSKYLVRDDEPVASGGATLEECSPILRVAGKTKRAGRRSRHVAAPNKRTKPRLTSQRRGG